MSKKDFVHIPVLTAPIIEHLTFPPDGIVVDATVGQGGHSALLSSRLSEKGRLIGIDVDPDSLAAARTRLENVRCRVDLIRENFGQLSDILSDLNVNKVDIILADLGFCSAQLEDIDRGISFQHEDSPLDMRLDDRLEKSAAWFVNRLSQKELANLIFQYGEERHSRKIARLICEYRAQKPFQTTGELKNIIVRAIGYGKGHRHNTLHPATRTFQALRIAVNHELDQLEKLLKQTPDRLNPGGMIAVISFHSLEDRIVKNDFNENRRNDIYELIVRKPIIADDEEIEINPRSRSAKLRIARRTDQIFESTGNADFKWI